MVKNFYSPGNFIVGSGILQTILNFLLLHVFLIRNEFISSLVLDSLKFKKLLELQRKAKKLQINSTLKSLPGSMQICVKTM